MGELGFEELDSDNQSEVRSLILAGLSDHWGVVNETLNPDLNDMTSRYAGGRTVLLRNDTGQLIGTGTIMPRGQDKAEILRMSVSRSARRQGVGRLIVEELLATARRWKVETVVLETTSSWDQVISFYLDCGFTVTNVAESEFGSDTWFEQRLQRVQSQPPRPPAT